MQPEDFFAGHPKARAVFDEVDEATGWLREAAERAT
jgi:hypothetical protein